MASSREKKNALNMNVCVLGAVRAVRSFNVKLFVR